ncbi:hypothetical protein [Armatimonas sp.]|uniref:hypothetical protein n=1 Tax=Armatimonas sp. TaxID=1872638 RepID=UPI00286B44A7|nr:hypothetical protein [Armatimonas sp.]
MKSPKIPRDPFLRLLLTALGIYCIAYICRASFLLGQTRFFTLFDDAMISLRYARNLAYGDGLVWNPGERVEGITNPLWTLLMVPWQTLLPIEWVALPVQLLSASCLLLNVIQVYRLAEMLAPSSRATARVAAVFTATYYSLNNWGMLGMEVGLLALLLTSAARLALQKPQRPWLLYALLLLGIWTRLDFLVPALVLSFVAARKPLGIATLLLLGIGLPTLLRVLYYGDPLPNTYYLKLTGYPLGLRVTRGLYVFWTFLWSVKFLPILWPLFYGIRQRGPAMLLCLIFLTQCAYSIWVGGDAWEGWGANRYISTAISLLFVVLAQAVVALAKDRRLWLLGLTALLVLLNNSRNGVKSLGRALLVVPPVYAHGGLGDNDNLLLTVRGLIVKDITQSDAVVAVTTAGHGPFFMERRCLDGLGKCDPVIAHQPMHQAPLGRSVYTWFYPGHLKFDGTYTIGVKKPDVVIEYKDSPGPEYERLNTGVGPLWLRTDSTKIHRDRLARHRRP